MSGLLPVEHARPVLDMLNSCSGRDIGLIVRELMTFPPAQKNHSSFSDFSLVVIQSSKTRRLYYLCKPFGELKRDPRESFFDTPHVCMDVATVPEPHPWKDRIVAVDGAVEALMAEKDGLQLILVTNDVSRVLSRYSGITSLYSAA